MPDVPPSLEDSDGATPKLRVAPGEPAAAAPFNYAPARRTPNRLQAWFRGWTHEHFTPERVGAFFKSLLWVAPLTLLIWVYAERQQQFTQGNVPLPIEVIGEPGTVVQVITPSDENIVFTFKGPKAAVDRIAEQFSPLRGNLPVQVKLDGTVKQGEQRISTLRLGEDKRLVDAGITVVSAEPKEIHVYIDTIVVQDVPVELRPEQRQRFVKPPVFTPAVVKVHGPKSFLRAQAEAKRLVAYADLGDQLAGVSTSSDQPIRLDDVKISLPFQNKHVAFDPAVVSVLVEPTPPKEFTFPSVRVAISASQELLNKYEIHAEQENLFNVKVSGPQQLIESLQTGTAPRAFLELPTTDPGPGTVDATVKYDFPPGVTVKEGPTKVKVTLTAR